jgi:ribose 5-phosphate isomerase B
VVAIGGRMHPMAEALSFAETFLATRFSGAERHGRRIAMLTDYESTGELPPLPDSAS